MASSQVLGATLSADLSVSRLLDVLPADLMVRILRPADKRCRRVCRAFRLHHNAGRQTLQLRPLPRPPHELQAYLAQLPQLASLKLFRSFTDLSPAAVCTALTGLILSRPVHIAHLNDSLAALQRLASLELWECDDLADISFLSACPHLTALSLASCEALMDVGPLASCMQLTCLSIQGGSFENVAALQACRHLTDVNLLSCQLLQSVAPLADACSAGLQTLSLRHCLSYTDYESLTRFTALRSLELDNVNINDVSAVTAASRCLTRLSLSGCLIENLTPCVELPELVQLDVLVPPQHPLAACASRLTSLGIDASMHEVDLAFLADSTRLTALRLGSLNLDFYDGLQRVAACAASLMSLSLLDCDTDDLSPLTACQQLTWLHVSGYNVDEAGDCGVTHINPLTACTRLAAIELCALPVDDVSAMQHLPHLTTLKLGDCEDLADISLLSGCSNLQELDLSGCGCITSSIALASCTALTRLSLKDCGRVSDVSALAACLHLQDLDLTDCGSTLEGHLQGVPALAVCTRLRTLAVHDGLDVSSFELVGVVVTREAAHQGGSHSGSGSGLGSGSQESVEEDGSGSDGEIL